MLAVGNLPLTIVHPRIDFDLIEVIKGEKLEASDWTADPEDDSSLGQERFETDKEIIFLA
jgi:hypothetical protein